QLTKSPCRQYSQTKHLPPCQPTPTRSPVFHAFTPEPVESITPAISWRARAPTERQAAPAGQHSHPRTRRTHALSPEPSLDQAPAPECSSPRRRRKPSL